MTMQETPPNRTHEPENRAPLIFGILTVVGTAFAWVATHFEQTRPLLEHPIMMLISMFFVYGMGWGTAYWVVIMPLERRVIKNEGIIETLRIEENKVKTEVTRLREMLARLETKLEMIQNPPVIPTNGNGGAKPPTST